MSAAAGPPVWRGFDQAELDRQYNSRGTVADFTVYTRQYAELTRAAQARLRCVGDLRYGPGEHETLDLYLPAAGAAAPLVVFVHGGNWQMLSKADSGFGAPAWVGAGAGFAALDFSLVPAVTVDHMAAQVSRALVWLHAHAAEHGCDPARIHIAGHSSGAHLVSQQLVADWPALGAPADLVKSAAFMSGLGDLEPVRLSFRNAVLKWDEAAVARLSLVRRTPTARCPLIVAVGEHETDDYRRQAREVAAFWRAQGQDAEFLLLAGRNHFDAVLDWADPSTALFAACARRVFGQSA